MALYLVAILTFSTVSYAADFGSIGGRPAHPNPDIPNSSSWFIYELVPGQVIEDELQVTNKGEFEETIMVYPVDYARSTDGGFALKQLADEQVEMGKWVKLAQNEVVLQPGESKLIPFTLTVPNDPKLDVGEHMGGIIMQKVDKGVDESTGGLKLLLRVGVRIYVTIPGQIVEKLELQPIKTLINERANKLIMQTTVENKGNVSSDLAINVKITDVSPSFLSKFVKTLQEFPVENTKNLQVLRNDTLVSSYEIPKPLMGKLQIEAWVDYENDGTKTLRAEPVVIYVWPSNDILLLIAFALGFLTFFVAWRKMRKHALKIAAKEKDVAKETGGELIKKKVSKKKMEKKALKQPVKSKTVKAKKSSK